MLALDRKLEIIGASFVFLFSAIACREVSISGTDYNEVSTTKSVITSAVFNNNELERSDLKKGYNDLRSANVDGNIVRQESGYEKRIDAEFTESKTIFKDERKKSFLTAKKGKSRKKVLHSEKKFEERISQEINREELTSFSSDNLGKRSARSVNSTDYYTQRKIVMEKFFARQREIAARYAKEREDVNAARNISTGYGQGKDTKDTLNIRVGLDTNNRPLETNNEVDTPETKTLNSGIRENAIRDVTDYSLPPIRNCTNVSLSGSLPRKSTNKLTFLFNETRESENELTINQNEEPTSPRSNRQDADDSNVDKRWGSCTGTLVYQHNLLLSLKGPSNLDAIFDVVMEGPLCITCVEVLRYNHTRALVSLDSGGRGYGYAKLRLKGYENEGFSYIVKVWGVKKTADDCARQL
ncbi:hypothetical protein KPH14_009720 [Odynerus spinipes]|uniref:Uncharacterized protein n=1 Tax=Odynerus spinipes TaxID=1348599 RepID=A0AAD9RQ22_9HYME|nr:hypothetical protein KPH14_009720 [Odynerus spinipes]